MYEYVYVYVICKCMYIYIYTHTYTIIYIYIYGTPPSPLTYHFAIFETQGGWVGAGGSGMERHVPKMLTS